jgi:SAM-dependent methyltransferase
LISDKLLKIARCPDCIAEPPAGANWHTWGRLSLEHGDDGYVLACAECGRRYPYNPQEGYLSLMPQSAEFTSGGHFEHTSKYVEHHDEFEAALDYRHISQPLLGAGVRNVTLRRLLKLQPSDTALEIGCGNGKFAYWNRRRVSHMVGLDPAPLFAAEALNAVDLAQADARALPFAPQSFSVIFSLDVMEHLTTPDVVQMFKEMRRVLKPGGRVMVYSNTRERSMLQPLISGSRVVGKGLARVGLADFHRDQLRKSDHVKDVATFDQLRDVVAQSGLVLEQVIFWNGVFQSLTENVIAKLGESVLTKAQLRARRKAAIQAAVSHEHGEFGNNFGEEAHSHTLESEADAAAELARREAKRQIARGGLYRAGLQGLTRLMLLDLVFFGKMRTGPFFILLRAE